ncbi:MAG: hypothetical protein MJ252_09110 [archaeon]|nr:hypothetical protein [archaeon]
MNIYKSFQHITNSDAAIPDDNKRDDEDDDLFNKFLFNENKNEVKNFNYDLFDFDKNSDNQNSLVNDQTNNLKKEKNDLPIFDFNLDFESKNSPKIVNYFITNKNQSMTNKKENEKRNKEEKLLRNRISAKKSREKKKKYISFLENEIVKLKVKKGVRNHSKIKIILRIILNQIMMYY